MNKQLLIVSVCVLFLFGCRSISETSGYLYTNHTINPIADSISDNAFMQILQPYKTEINNTLSEIVAHAEKPLMSYRPESPLSNFLSDLLLFEAQKYATHNTLGITPQVALYNHGGIRASIPAGEISMHNIFELMPFDNKLVYIKLTGEQLIILANYIATRKGEGVAGMSFGIYDNKAVGIKVQGVKVDMKTNYWLVTSDYIANGGDGMKIFNWAEKRHDTSFLIRDLIIKHLSDLTNSNQKVSATTDGRIYYVE